MNRIIKPLLARLLLIGLLIVLGGCGRVSLLQPVLMPKLTATQEQDLGEAVAARLIQMLGGSLHDEELNNLLGESGASTGSSLSIVDRRVAEMYPLPGGRIVFTRGLLTRLNNLEEYEKLLSLGCRLSGTAYQENASQDVARVTAEYFSGNFNIYDPRAADIRLAERFAETPCAASCLDDVFTPATGNRKSLPEPLAELDSLLSGYELLEQARQLEKSEEQGRAMITYLQAATVVPDNARILSELGMAYLRAGDLQSAKQHLWKADKLTSSYQTKMGLGYIYLQTRKIRQAEVLIAESVALLPVVENLFLLAEAREKNADIENARLLYRIVADNDRFGKLGRTSLKRLNQIKDNQ